MCPVVSDADKKKQSTAAKALAANFKIMQTAMYANPKKGSSKMPCYYQMLGSCQYGGKCSFSHDKAVLDKAKKDPKVQEALKKLREQAAGPPIQPAAAGKASRKGGGKPKTGGKDNKGGGKGKSKDGGKGNKDKGKGKAAAAAGDHGTPDVTWDDPPLPALHAPCELGCLLMQTLICNVL